MSSLHRRSFLTLLATAVLAAGLLGLALSLLLVPGLSRHLAELEARANLTVLAHSLPSGDRAIKDAYLRRATSPSWERVELVARGQRLADGAVVAVLVPIPESTLALATTVVADPGQLWKAGPGRWVVLGVLTGYLSLLALFSWGAARWLLGPLEEPSEAEEKAGPPARDRETPPA
jgi:hypothetical protein